MSPYKFYGQSMAICIAIGLFSCQSRNSDEQANESLTDSMSFDEELNKPHEADSVLNEAYDYSDCLRAPAEQVIKETIHPHSVFELSKNNHTGIETLQFGNGDKLVIKNWGCEYYILTFRFETTRFNGDTTNVNYWLDKSAILMREIIEALDTPLDISEGVHAIESIKNPKQSYQLGQEIVYQDGDIRQYATLDRIQKLDRSQYALEISFAMGPL